MDSRCRFLCDTGGVSIRSRSRSRSLNSLAESSWKPALTRGLTGKKLGLGVPELPVLPVPLSPVYTSVRSSAYTPSLHTVSLVSSRSWRVNLMLSFQRMIFTLYYYLPMADSWRPLGMNMMTKVMAVQAIIPQAAATSW